MPIFNPRQTKIPQPTGAKIGTVDNIDETIWFVKLGRDRFRGRVSL